MSNWHYVDRNMKLANTVLCNHYVQLGGLTLLAFLIRIYNIDGVPLWLDETFSVRQADLGIHRLWQEKSFNHPPLYFLFQGIALEFGRSEAWIRSPSLIFGTLSVPTMYFLGRSLGQHQVGILAALLLTINSVYVEFSQEARPYALFYLIVIMATLGCLEFIKQYRKGFTFQLQSLKTPPAWWLGVYMVAMIVGIYTHAMAAYVMAALNLIVLVYWATELKFERRFIILWLSANFIVITCGVPWLLRLVNFAAYGTENFTWLEHIDFNTALVKTLNVEGFRHLNFASPYFSFIYVSFSAWGFWLLRSKKNLLGFFIAFTLIAPLTIWLTGFYKPIFMYRVIVWINVPVILGVSVALCHMPNRIMKGCVLALIVSLSSLSTWCYYLTPQVHDWRKITNVLDKGIRSEDALVFDPKFIIAPIDYYSSYHPDSSSYFSFQQDQLREYKWPPEKRMIRELQYQDAFDRKSAIWFVASDRSNQALKFRTEMKKLGWAETFEGYGDTYVVYRFAYD